jgi:hypothetical protein
MPGNTGSYSHTGKSQLFYAKKRYGWYDPFHGSAVVSVSMLSEDVESGDSVHELRDAMTYANSYIALSRYEQVCSDALLSAFSKETAPSRLCL